MYPKIMSLHARHDRPSFTDDTLQQLSWLPAVILDWNDPARRWAPGEISVSEWLNNQGDYLRSIAYIPAYYWWKPATMSYTSAPHRVTVQRHISQMDWWTPIEPWPGQNLIKPEAVRWLKDYILENFEHRLWFAIHLDVLVPEVWHLGGSEQLSHELVAAGQELAAALKDDTVVLANGAWAPATDSITSYSPYIDVVDGPMVEQWPKALWYDGKGGRGPTTRDAWQWHMELADLWISRGATYYTFHADKLHNTPAFGTWIKTELQGVRYVLASACLADAWFMPPSRQTPFWSDEMCVLNGNTALNAKGIGWLGEPLDGRNQNGALWLREFEHGLVVVNPTTAPAIIDLPSGQWRRINGWYDLDHNNGASVDRLILQAMDAYLLVRATGASTPDKPSRPPADDMATMRQRIDGLEKRVARLESWAAKLGMRL